MQRTISFLATAGLALLTGCATTQPLTVSERDPIDALIAKHAASATQALRELSEASGHSRVVATPAPKPVASLPTLTPNQGRRTDQQIDASSSPPRHSPIAVEIVSPPPPPAAQQTLPVSGSSGVVASGGLLSVPPAGLERIITVRWTGELEELLSRIAHETGWRLGERTGLRAAPVIISISAENRSAFDTLRDIGAIAGTSADIMVSAPAKQISVRYPKR